MTFNQKMSAFCILDFEECDTRIQKLFSTAAFDAVLETDHGKDSYLIKTKRSLKIDQYEV